uniref:CCR4-NOT transcription complex subunit 3 n=1 Tax=Strigamia maritima TaxID=126957 RepID=T1IZ81_STRMM
MADRRKLQGEIDRCLKKVSEGVETFEDIWQKVHNAANSNQKEKYEADLKKEIKKLQRLRDQIKSWIASGEIKDKSILLDNRKLIETQMERFKVVERETKTKAYSKEGLGAAQKLDPAQKEKDEITCWLATSIESLNIQVDQFESEIESLLAGTKKKKIDKDKQDRIDKLKIWLEKHRFHIKQLETLMRMLDNSTIDVDQIKKIRDDVEYYIESSQEPDFEENEFIYDDLDLEDMTAEEFLITGSSAEDENSTAQSTPSSTNSGSPSPNPGLVNHSKSCDDRDDIEKKKHKVVEDGVQPVKPSAVRANNPISNSSSNSNVTSSNKNVPTTPNKNTSNSTPNNSSSSSGNIMVNHTLNSSPPGPAYSVAVGGQQHNAAHNSMDGVKMVNSIDHSSCTFTSTSSINNNNSGGHGSAVLLSAVSTPLSSQSQSIQPAPSPIISSAAVHNNSSSVFNSQPLSVNSSTAIVANTSHLNSCVLMNGPMTPKVLETMSSLKSIAQQAVVNAGLESQIPITQPQVISERELCDNNSLTGPTKLKKPVATTTSTTEAHVPPLLGVQPLGQLQLNKESFYQLGMLEAAFHHLPHPSDSERLRHYLPRNPFPTPSYYAQTPPPHSDTVEFFQRLPTETLFFIFYYMEGTKAQYLAAKALKKQSWRFHTKYMMWFQRHEEPKTITDEFEQGTYIYFDYEKWGQRKKEGFTFEYRIRPKDALKIVVNVYQKETVSGFWKGTTPSILRCAPGVGVYFGTLHWLTINLTNGKTSPIEAMYLGAFARTISGVAILPFTVIKTRFESNIYKYQGVFHALNKIYTTEGARGLYCGLLPTLIRDVPFSSIYLLIYTQIKQSLGVTKDKNTEPYMHFLCAVVAGTFASLITHPADVIKTQMQLHPHHQKVGKVALHIYKVAGARGYFIGLSPRILRRTLVTATAWTTYEQVMLTVGLKQAV